MIRYAWVKTEGANIPDNTVAWLGWTSRAGRDYTLICGRDLPRAVRLDDSPVLTVGGPGGVVGMNTPKQAREYTAGGRYLYGWALVQMINSGCPCGICQGIV